jgi:hypothetical protein
MIEEGDDYTQFLLGSSFRDFIGSRNTLVMDGIQTAPDGRGRVLVITLPRGSKGAVNHLQSQLVSSL